MPPVSTVANALASQPTETTPFVPQSPVVFTRGNPAKGINSRARALLLKVINKTRTGEKKFTIEAKYERVTDGERRNSPEDFQIPSSVPHNVHSGLVINARETQAGNWILVLKDAMRSNRGEPGFTSLRLDGLRSFVKLTEDDGPLAPRKPVELLDGDVSPVIDIV